MLIMGHGCAPGPSMAVGHHGQLALPGCGHGVARQARTGGLRAA